MSSQSMLVEKYGKLSLNYPVLSGVLGNFMETPNYHDCDECTFG